jgi:WD40 repeat protein
MLLAAVLPVLTALWFRAEQAQARATSKATEADLANEAAQKEKRQADQLREQAEYREARLAQERGHEYCCWGALPRGLVWLTRGLELAVLAGNEDLERAARINLAEWRRQLCQPGPVLRPGGRIHGLAISPDGKRALVGAGLSVREWDLTTGKQVGKEIGASDLSNVEDNFREIRGVAYSPDGKTALVSRSTGAVLMWDLEKSRRLFRLRHGKEDVWAVAFSPNGRTFLSTGADEKGPCVGLWDSGTGRPVGEPLRHADVVTDAAFSPDGTRVVSGCRDGTVRLWRLDGCRQDGAPLRHPDWVSSVAYSPDGKLLCSICRDGTAHLWDFETRQAVSSPLFGLRGVVSARFSLDGAYLLTGSWDGQGRLWHVQSRHPVGAALIQADYVGSLAFSSDKRTFLTGSLDGTVRVWRLPGPNARPPLPHAQPVLGLQFSQDDRLLHTCDQDHAQIWDAASGKPRGQMRTNGPFGLTGFSLASDGKTVALGSSRPAVDLWDCSDPDRPRPLAAEFALPLKAQDRWVQMRYVPNGKRLVTLTESPRYEATLWGLRGRPVVERVFPHDAQPRCLAISPDGETLAVGSRGRQVWLWGLGTGGRLLTLVQPGQVLAVALGKGDRLLVGCRDGAAHVWDVKTGDRLVKLQQQIDVLAAAWSPDGRTALTGCADGTTRAWDAVTGMPLGPVRRHQGAVAAVAFGNHGATFATASLDRSAIVWDAPASPLEGRLEAIKAWTSVLTGLELDGSGVERELTAGEKDRWRGVLTMPEHATFAARMAGETREATTQGQ